MYVCIPDFFVNSLYASLTQEATCTFSDVPILNYRLGNEFYSKGRCGNPGGFCSDPQYSDAKSCECPGTESEAFGAQACKTKANKWTSVHGNLVACEREGGGTGGRKGREGVSSLVGCSQEVGRMY